MPPKDFKATSNFEPSSGFAERKAHFMKEHGLDPKATVMPLGFHGDGVPFQVKKTLEVFSWNFAAQPDMARQL